MNHVSGISSHVVLVIGSIAAGLLISFVYVFGR